MIHNSAINNKMTPNTQQDNDQISSTKRLNKYISESGYCSRRGADKLIEDNRVTINDTIPELGTKVQTGDVVKVDGKIIAATADNKSDRIYIAYNKPTGITCTTEHHVRNNIIDAINHPQRIFPIGRLDKPSEGLIFLTSDGDIVNKILRAENAHDKEYLVTVDKPLSERFIERMQRGVPILGTTTKLCIVKVKSRFAFTIILTQGLNRQIRRMCEYLGYEVRTLKRTRIMSIDLRGLKVGQWRNLTEQEMININVAVANSSKTAVIDDTSTKTNTKIDPYNQQSIESAAQNSLYNIPHNSSYNSPYDSPYDKKSKIKVPEKFKPRKQKKTTNKRTLLLKK